MASTVSDFMRINYDGEFDNANLGRQVYLSVLRYDPLIMGQMITNVVTDAFYSPPTLAESRWQLAAQMYSDYIGKKLPLGKMPTFEDLYFIVREVLKRRRNAIERDASFLRRRLNALCNNNNNNNNNNTTRPGYHEFQYITAEMSEKFRVLCRRVGSVVVFSFVELEEHDIDGDFRTMISEIANEVDAFVTRIFSDASVNVSVEAENSASIGIDINLGKMWVHIHVPMYFTYGSFGADGAYLSRAMRQGCEGDWKLQTVLKHVMSACNATYFMEMKEGACSRCGELGQIYDSLCLSHMPSAQAMLYVMARLSGPCINSQGLRMSENWRASLSAAYCIMTLARMPARVEILDRLCPEWRDLMCYYGEDRYGYVTLEFHGKRGVKKMLRNLDLEIQRFI